MSNLPNLRNLKQEDRALLKGREILTHESRAIARLAENLDASFSKAVELLLNCHGRVVVSGMGKAGLVGQKISASLSSTGTPSYFLHPAEAVHGDLGSIQCDDLSIVLSYSGETEEIAKMLPTLRSQASALIAITSKSTSTLARHADVALLLGTMDEACPLGLAPSSTTTAMMALGDALALVTSERKGFTREHFAKFHPAGALGRALMNVEQMMRPLSDCRVALQTHSLRTVLVQASRPGRRTGAVMLVDSDGRLSGVFTDSDLAKLLERSGEDYLDQPIEECMTKNFQTVTCGQRLPVALSILAERKISELPVMDAAGFPVGIIDITDVMSMLSGNSVTTEQTASEMDNIPHDSSDQPTILPLRRNHSKQV
jgi:arabinose-5-phosphate isomerase